MGEALKALESASRRDLQALAKQLQLCRGNAKSNVIVAHAMQFMDDHPKDGEQQVLDALDSSGNAVSVSSPVATKVRAKKEDESDMEPEDEPVERVKTKSSSAAIKQVTPKEQDKSKSKHVSSYSATTTSPPTAAASAKSRKPSVTALPMPKKSPTTTGKIQPTSVEKKKVDSRKKESTTTTKKESTTTTKTAPINKKVEIKKARKAVEALVKSVTDLSFVGESRVRCSTTGHEMLADVNIINMYLHGKRYQKARNLKLSFAKYAPMFVDHPDESKPDMLWCNVTDSAIARDDKRVKDHMTAPKYQKQLPIWKKQEAAKKKAEEEEKQRREARILAAKRKRLEAAKENGDKAVVSDRPIKRKRLAA